MLLVGKVLVHLGMTAGASTMLLDVLLVLLNLCCIHLAQGVDSELDIRKQSITSRARKVLTNDDTHHLETFRVRGHGVSRDNPTTLTQLMGNSKFVKVVLLRGVEAESNEW